MQSNKKVYICEPESFNTNISHQLFDYMYNNLCEFTELEHKFKSRFFTQIPVLNVREWQLSTNKIKSDNLRRGDRVKLMF